MLENGLVGLAEVARKEQPVARAGRLGGIEHDLRRTEDMPSVVERERKAFAQRRGRVQMDRHDETHERVHIGLFIKRLEKALALRLTLLVDELQITVLEEA